MRVGEFWWADFLDHFENSGESAWQPTDSLNIAPQLCRAIGTVVKTGKDSFALAVSYGDGESTAPFIIAKSTVINSGRISLPPKRRTKASG